MTDHPDEGTQPDATDAQGDAYGGVFGAFPYAFSASDSLLFKSYVLVGGLIALAVTVLFGLALVTLVGKTAAGAGGTFSFSRAFFIVVGLAVVAPLVGPVLFVARRHRTATPDARFDGVQAGLGYLFVVSLYVAGVVFAPADELTDVAGVAGTAVESLNALPAAAGLVPPVAVALLVVLVTRRWD